MARQKNYDSKIAAIDAKIAKEKEILNELENQKAELEELKKEEAVKMLYEELEKRGLTVDEVLQQLHEQ